METKRGMLNFESTNEYKASNNFLCLVVSIAFSYSFSSQTLHGLWTCNLVFYPP